MTDNDLTLHYKYFDVIPLHQERRRKTRDYQIVGRRGDPLGRIVWFSRWRQYVLRPTYCTDWSAGCLHDVCDAIAKINERRSP